MRSEHAGRVDIFAAEDVKRETEAFPQPSHIVTVHGPAGIGKTTWVERWLPRDDATVRVDLRGATSTEMVRAVVAGGLGVVCPDDDTLFWWLRANPTRIWLDHADLVRRAESDRFAAWVAQCVSLPGVRFVVTADAPVGIPGEMSVPVVALGAGAERLLPGNVDPDIALRWFQGHPTLLRLANPLLAIDAGAVRAVVEECASAAGDPVQALGQGLAELAIRYLGYRLPEVPGLVHLAAELPAGFDAASLAAVLSDSIDEVLDAVLAAGLMREEAGRYVAAVPVPGGRGSALHGLFRERYETHLGMEIEAQADDLERTASPDVLTRFSRSIATAIHFGTWCRSEETRRRIAVRLPRLVAHCGCPTHALQIAEHLVEDSDPDRVRGNRIWYAILKSDIALAERDLGRARAGVDSAGPSPTLRSAPEYGALRLAEARLAWAEGDADSAFRAGADALRSATVADDLAGQADALRMVGAVSGRRGDPVSVRDAFEYAAGLYEQIGDVRRDALCRAGQGDALRSGGWYRESFESYVVATEMLRELGAVGDVARVQLRAAELLMEAGDAERAILVADAAIDAARRAADRGGTVRALAVQRSAFFKAGLPEAAYAALLEEHGISHRVDPDRAQAVRSAMMQCLARHPSGEALFRRIEIASNIVRTEGVDAIRSVLRLRSTTGIDSSPSWFD